MVNLIVEHQTQTSVLVQLETDGYVIFTSWYISGSMWWNYRLSSYQANWFILCKRRVWSIVVLTDLNGLILITILNFLKASISIHGSVLLILQKHCKTPLKTQTIHSNSYTTFWIQNIANTLVVKIFYPKEDITVSNRSINWRWPPFCFDDWLNKCLLCSSSAFVKERFRPRKKYCQYGFNPNRPGGTTVKVKGLKS